MENENTQEKYVELQLLNEQASQLQQRINLISNQIQQLKDISINLEGFGKLKEDSEILFSLGPGIYTKGILKDNNLLVNIGSDIIVNKSVPDTIKTIEVQINELQEALVESESIFSSSCLRMQELQDQVSDTHEDK